MIRTLVFSAAVVLTATTAQAESGYLWGEVKSVDKASRALSMSNGRRYTVPRNVELDDVAAGMMVEIFTESGQGNNKVVHMMSQEEIDRRDAQDEDD